MVVCGGSFCMFFIKRVWNLQGNTQEREVFYEKIFEAIIDSAINSTVTDRCDRSGGFGG